MVRAIITWSLHNRLIVLLGTLLLIVVGLYSAFNLNVEAYPDPTPPLVEVITQNPGASPEEMERLIGIPIEIALNGMPGLEDLRSTSIAGLNDVKCVFTYGTDYWKARQEVINRIERDHQPAAERDPAACRPGAPPARSSATCSKAPGTPSTSSSRSRTGCSTGSSRPCPA